MKTALKWILGSIFLSIGLVAHADLLVSNTLVNATVVNFDDQPTVESVAGPIQIGGLVGEDITASSPTGQLYTNYDGWGLFPNGDWGIPRTYISQNDDGGTLLISFNDGPVSAVGGFMSYYSRGNGGTLVISALDDSMQVIESHNIVAEADIVTPEFNGGAFRGIDRNGVDEIYHFQITGSYPPLDDLTFIRGAAAPTVPVPTMGLAGLLLTIAAMLIMGAVARRRYATGS